MKSNPSANLHRLHRLPRLFPATSRERFLSSKRGLQENTGPDRPGEKGAKGAKGATGKPGPADVTSLNDWRNRRHNRDLDNRLKRQPGRCRECGHHIATQGHRPTCNERTRRAQH